MIVKRSDFIERYFILLKRKLEKALPERGFESDFLIQAMKIDAQTSDHVLEEIRRENLEPNRV